MGWDGYSAQDLATHGFGRSRSGGRKRKTTRATASCSGCAAKKRRSKGTRRRKSSTSRSTSRRSKRASGKPARLVKGSAAAKAFMAKLRKMRK